MMHVHKVVLKEVLQLSLGGRVREISNVQYPALSGAGDSGLVLGLDRSVAAGDNGGGLGGVFLFTSGDLRWCLSMNHPRSVEIVSLMVRRCYLALERVQRQLVPK